MFEFLFQNSRTAFARGEMVLLASWPPWVLGALILACACALAVLIRRRMPRAASSVRGWRAAVIWVLQSSLLAVVLTLLWQPALLVSTLKPQQNVVAVLMDDSASMALQEDGSSRLDAARKALSGGVLERIEKRFQTRLYRASDRIERVPSLDKLKAEGKATLLGEVLKQVSAESAGLPLGAVVLISDGADNAGGIDLETLTELKTRRVPVHTVGFGREHPGRDLEVVDVQAPTRGLVDSRIASQITIQQWGYTGRKARLAAREGAGRLLASREITLAGDGRLQSETLMFNPGGAGAKELRFSVEPLEGEQNQRNNSTSRLLHVADARPRILYFEGEPRWEFKFIRRAVEDDKAVRLVTMLRTTQNEIYRQGVDGAGELAGGFPGKVEELFGFHGLIIGSVEAGYFTTAQQELIRQFVDRRGGGLLLLGGRASLSDGGWANVGLSDLIPVVLSDRRGTFHRDPASVRVTAPGIDSVTTRLVEDPAGNLDRWGKMPLLADYQEVGAPKPGATILLEAGPGGRGALPLLITQNYGRGRTAVMATSGTWRWQMSQAVEDTSHETFWQQMLRWLVAGTPGQVVASTSANSLFDDGRVKLSAEVRDKNFAPVSDRKVEARIVEPSGMTSMVDMLPDPVQPGLYRAEYTAAKPGHYLAEITAQGTGEEPFRDVVMFQRQDGLAEHFHSRQNRDLLEKLAQQTGGRYWRPEEIAKLPDEISYSEAGITVRETRSLWNLPAVFLLILVLRASEWLLRRTWGIV